MSRCESALFYASHALAVFPLWPIRSGVCACPKRHECGDHAGKHPLGALAPNGLNDATTHAGTITAWWRVWPDANIGVRMGDGIFALDVDPRHGGDDTLATLERQHGSLPRTWEVLTGGGGRHILFRRPAGTHIPSRAAALGAGLDVKGDGGYLVGAVSGHRSGGKYVWNVESRPDTLPLADAPRWVLTLATSAPKPNGHKSGFTMPEQVPEGTRNATLFASARSLKAKGFSPKAIRAALEAENSAKCSPPLEPGELADVLQSVLTQANRPDFAQARTNLTEAPHLTDVGNAQRFATRHAGVVGYCWPRGRFYVWTGTVWEPDEAGRVYALAKVTARQILAEALEARTDEARKNLSAWALKSESEPRLRALVNLARSDPALVVTPEELDANAWALNVENGIINLKTGELVAHDPAALCTKIAPVVFDPAAQCPQFLEFMDQIFAGRAPLIEFLRRCFGYALAGVANEQVIIVLHGLGANGKSTLLKIVHGLLGAYALATPPESLLMKRQAGIPNDLARLAGARMVSSVELDGGRRLAENLIKSMTGGDSIVARFLNREFFEFQPTFTLFLSVNRKPRIAGRDHAIWRRIRLVPFTETIPEAQQDRTLADRLIANEGPGILRWIVEGSLTWQRDGLGFPDDVREATAEYRSEQDTLAGFLGDRCILEPGAHVSGSALYASYAAWAAAGGDRPLNRSEFREALLHRDGIHEHRTKTARGWQGIRVREPAEPEPAAPVEAREPVNLWG